MSSTQHRQAAGRPELAVAVLTLSDTRTVETDSSGKLIQDLLRQAGHRVAHYSILKDEPDLLRAEVERLLATGEVQAILTTGGTGISRRDATIAALAPLWDAPLPGFGELFRFLSYQEIGSAAMLSRAAAGVARGVLVFAMPGSSNAVRLAMEKLILPELPHLAWELTR